jgi:hypothetical protein
MKVRVKKGEGQEEKESGWFSLTTEYRRKQIPRKLKRTPGK